MKHKCVIFTRVSTCKQDYKSQFHNLQKCAIRDGYKQNEMIPIGDKESAILLKTDERKGIKKLFNLIDKGEIDRVYIYDASRIARNIQVFHEITDYILAHDVSLVNYTPYLVLSNDQDINSSQLIFNILGAFAAQEMQIKRERFEYGRYQKAKMVGYMGKKPPFGYKYNNDKTQIEYEEEEKTIVQEVYNYYEDGQSQPSITRIIKREHPSINIQLRTINRILNNEIYTGKERKEGYYLTTKKGEKGRVYKYRAQMPPIITQEQYDRCRQIASENKYKRHPLPSNIFYAEFLIRCHCCGGKMSGKSYQGTYFCHNAYNTMKDINNFGAINCTEKKMISANILDSLLWHIASIYEAKECMANNAEKIKEYNQTIKYWIKEKTNLKNELDKKENSKKNIINLYANADITNDDFRKRKDIVNKNIETIKKEIIEIEGTISHYENLKKGENTYHIKTNNGGKLVKAKDLISTIESIRSNKNEKDRYNIIHRHIKLIKVYDSSETIPNLGKNGTPRKTIVKKIDITTINGKNITYYYLPIYHKIFEENPTTNISTPLHIDIDYRFGYACKENRKKTSDAKKEHNEQLKKEQLKNYYTANEVSKLLGISIGNVYHLGRYGVKIAHIGHSIAFDKESILQYKEFASNLGNITPRYISNALNISMNKIWNDIKKGVLKAQKRNKNYYITNEEYNNYKKIILHK